ncbi:RNA pyrophosphohydrolase [uncultured archaeon]|nr:RNA pyrophosphohydrolase [uncultured archaeon]
MRVKHGVTAIIFDERDGKRYFLLLHRVLNWKGWEFCKGGIEEGENPVEAVLREAMEETGLEPRIVIQLPKKVTWTHAGMKYTYTPFILSASMDSKIDLQQQIIEHDGFRWVEESGVESMLKHEDNKKTFREALAALNSEMKSTT